MIEGASEPFLVALQEEINMDGQDGQDQTDRTVSSCSSFPSMFKFFSDGLE